ncbi:transient-receptor-potential-like protein [Zootermopsis nevadensis]|uniref:transient-receptor-potential-like protein n=1 Tax=Zootermopsis nevadensis TaxID=136037 RepID=UPI000B8E32EC|nr:transient-receptor-potential-like protein [Zootermopsis nevadensis]
MADDTKGFTQGPSGGQLFTLDEKKFFSLVDEGDVNAVQKFLEENPGFDINCVDSKGVSALQMAVHNHDGGMVTFLLDQRDILLSDCALRAVSEDQHSILLLLMERMAVIHPDLEFAGCPDSAYYPEYMTPLMLAAQCDNYEIIGMLMERGHKIQHPHPPKCSCNCCREALKDTKRGERLLDVYRAITNPTYICQNSTDQILTAFELNKELMDYASTDLELRPTYLDLAKKVRVFATDLIGGGNCLVWGLVLMAPSVRLPQDPDHLQADDSAPPHSIHMFSKTQNRGWSLPEFAHQQNVEQLRYLHNLPDSCVHGVEPG